MSDQYSDSPEAPSPLLLAVDSGSPRVSVAVGRAGRVLAERSTAIERSSRSLLQMVDETLEAAGCEAAALAGLIALRGPGSFTGLRVGLATLLGLHLALEVPAVAVPTLSVLATAAEADGGTVLAAVDALRGEWHVQPFAAGSPPRPLADPARADAERLASFAPCVMVGFGVGRLRQLAGFPGGIELREAGPLAGAALAWHRLSRPAWDPSTLTDPLYLRPAAVTPQPPRE